MSFIKKILSVPASGEQYSYKMALWNSFVVSLILYFLIVCVSFIKHAQKLREVSFTMELTAMFLALFVGLFLSQIVVLVVYNKKLATKK